MSISERSFADRLQRAVTIQTATAVFLPAFDPTDTSLEPAAFLTFIGTLETLNTEVGTLSAQYTTGVAQRTPMVADIKERSARVLEYVKSNSAWKAFLPGVKKFVDKIRNNLAKAPKAPSPEETPGSPPAKKRNQGEQSFGEIKDNFEKLIATLAAVPGYNPPAAELSIANLTTLATGFSAQNFTMSTLGITLGMKQKARLEGYDGPGGLKDKMKSTKSAVRSQYGTNSPANEQVKGIGL